MHITKLLENLYSFVLSLRRGGTTTLIKEIASEKDVWVLVPNKEMRNKIDAVFSEYPKKWGRGEWTAKTLDDAKQMAIDFSQNIS